VIALKKIALIVMSVLTMECAAAAPVFLVCRTTSRTIQGGQLPYENSYQVIFNESASTVTVDGGIPFNAKIGATMIDWGRDAEHGLYLWHIDRLTGSFTLTEPSEQDDGFGYHYPATERGRCAAPPPRKF
jgi:hypothetical protein